MTDVNVSLNWNEYHMLLDALRDKTKSIRSELKDFEQIFGKLDSDMTERALSVIDGLKEDLEVLLVLEAKIKKNSKPGGIE